MDAPTAVRRTSAVMHGHVVRALGTDMPTLTFRLENESGEAVAVSPVLKAAGDSVSWKANGLTAGRHYACRLQGQHGRAELQSAPVTFVTQPNVRPALNNFVLLSHGPTSVILAYTVSDTGGEPVTTTGISYKEEGTGESATVRVVPDSAVGRRARVSIGSLSQRKNYQFVAFAENTIGRTESQPLSYTTGSTVVLEQPGDLSLLMSDDLYRHRRLAFSGKMNGDDLLCLRRMMGRDAEGAPTAGQLADVDLTDVDLVAGGASYGSGRYVQDHVVGYGLFADCTQLTRLLLPASATTIEKDALRGCTALSSLTLPASAAAVTPSADCPALASIQVSAANEHYASIDGVLFDKKATRIVWFPMGKTGDYVLPSTVTAVGDYAFQQCRVTRFVLPSSLTSLGRAVFFGSSVEEVSMPDGLKLVPTATFQQCGKLGTVRLGKATELVSDYAFDGCPLSDLYVSSALPPVCTEHAFATTGRSITKNCVLHVPAKSLALYRADATWGQFTHITAIK